MRSFSPWRSHNNSLSLLRSSRFSFLPYYSAASQTSYISLARCSYFHTTHFLPALASTAWPVTLSATVRHLGWGGSFDVDTVLFGVHHSSGVSTAIFYIYFEFLFAAYFLHHPLFAVIVFIFHELPAGGYWQRTDTRQHLYLPVRVG
ncbi:hypothetical protein ASPFODRAFT_545623 [Aspergillus luchuensis CBS 106.47]|uniref:Uncharacterized protein n=1 Tax=Aspergillus luchuensis (strain CBS 106.47) TaxID=1137211 RepID=A0A1M3TNR2_ASPLC|nr:hypothetical protein ASPFODRAFT_545623 [Aspergillus luchuensis CBS 106.47]